MTHANTRWHKTLFWGTLVVILYWGLFQYADDLSRLAHTTTRACAIVEDGKTLYYSKPTPESCAEKGGTLIEGNWLFVLVPILIAFVVSYVHGTFTSMFWDSLGLRAASKKK
jgi:hypothetical protein